MVMKKPMLKSSHVSRPPVARHVNAFVTEEDRERERQVTAEQADTQPRPITVGDDAALKARQVEDYLGRYGRVCG